MALGVVISGVGTAFGLAASVITGVGTAFGLIVTAVGALLSPLGLVVAGIVALAHTLYMHRAQGPPPWTGSDASSRT